jgi:FAD/FMN-containing dehydrogenase
MNVHTRWDSADQDDGCTGWAREFYDATKPFATGGVYVNFISEGEDRVQGAYGGNYARLAAVKAKYDPDNFFSVNQNVRPS